jgi:hypothetical protein
MTDENNEQPVVGDSGLPMERPEAAEQPSRPEFDSTQPLVPAEFLGDDPEPMAQPDPRDAMLQAMQYQQGETTRVLGEMTSTLAALREAGAAQKAEPTDEYGEEEVNPAMARMEKQMLSMQGMLERNQQQQAAVRGQSVANEEIRAASEIIGGFAQEFTLTKNLARHATKIGRTVLAGARAMIEANPHNHGVTREHLKQWYANEVREHRELLGGVPSVKVAEAGNQFAVNRNTTSLGGGESPSPSDAPGVDIDSPEYTKGCVARGRAALANLAARKQGAG